MANDNAGNAPAFIPQNQAWPTRAPIMRETFRNYFGSRAARILEVGVWYGLGSTDIWLSECHAGSELFFVDSWVPYSSDEDLADPGWNYKQVDDLSTDAFLSAYLNTKKWAAQRAQDQIRVHLTRGSAATFLPALASDSFDFLYIDGDHKYENAKRDLQQAKRLVKKDFGLICGDDLEFLPTPELYDLARQHPRRDYLREPHNLHPGVLAAVYEEFGRVNMENGFWWVFCHNSEWKNSISDPAYQRPQNAPRLFNELPPADPPQKVSASTVAASASPSKEEPGILARGQVEIGQRYLNDGEFDIAEISFNRALAVDPQCEPARQGLAEIKTRRAKDRAMKPSGSPFQSA